MEKTNISSKRTRSERSSTSSTESSSPKDKRSKTKKSDLGRCEIEVAEIEEETVRDMTNTPDNQDIKPVLDMILKKLEKLDAIELSLRDISSRLARTETTVERLESETRMMDSKIDTMDAGLTNLNDEVSALRGKLTEKEKQINELHMKHLYLESYSRRENLKFFGIPEKEVNAVEGGEALDTRTVLNHFLETALGFHDPSNTIEIQRVHRVGKSINGKPRPILARFLRFQDRERILSQGFKLKDTEYMILQDFPQEIIEKRRKKMPKLKEAKEKGLRVSFSKSEPDKLIINGKVVS